MNRIQRFIRRTALLAGVSAVALSTFAQGQQTGEWATLENGSPAMVGQTTMDHLFARNTYDGTTYDNVVSFKSGEIQTMWLWLDDDEIYLNENVQALPPIPYDRNGHLYNEITYSSFQMNLYLPEGIELVTIENEDGDEESFAQGDRLPNTAIYKAEANSTKMIDGISYNVYSIISINFEEYGTHLSARNARMYETRGALKKDDAPLIGLYLKNNNQSSAEGRLADIIIANVEFGMCEPLIVEPEWGPNEYRFIYGTGGNNETQRFQLYNRIALYGSNGIDEGTILVNQLSLDVTSKEMTVGENFTLTATVLPENATDPTLTWATSNPSVATVNDGIVTAIAPGTATITATTNDGSNLSATCTVTVLAQAMPGDANGDGNINTSDITALIYYLLTDNPSQIIVANADVNGDGNINTSDITELIYRLLNSKKE